jgi:tetratricopeptide (TPR) repeat protein
LAEGQGFLDFKPGMALHEVMDVYLPRYEGNADQFIMASHADRLKLSKCFQVSKQLDCTTCHNPHKSVRTMGNGHFNAQCQTCHTQPQGRDCKAAPAQRAAQGDNCVSCHMPNSGSIDIPHVTVHDHRIAVHTAKGPQKQGGFKGLSAINNPKPSPRSKALAYLQQFEKFGGEPYMLDSAALVLNTLPKEQHLDLWIYHRFLKGEWEWIVQALGGQPASVWLSKWNTKESANRDAWTCYRVAEAYAQRNQPNVALAFMQQAIDLAPWIPEFYQKQGALYLRLQQTREALQVYERLERDFPESAETYSSLGYLWMASGQLERSKSYLDRALALDPDNSKVWLNAAAWAMAAGEPKNAEIWLVKVLSRDPSNAKALQALKMIRVP